MKATQLLYIIKDWLTVTLFVSLEANVNHCHLHHDNGAAETHIIDWLESRQF